MKEPKVSILIPTYNRAKWLAESVSSILAQTHINWELIILNNGCSDGTESYLNTIKDGRISIYTFEENNQEHAYNFLSKKATGKYCVNWTDDDVMEPFNLEEKVKVMENDPTLSFCFSATTCIDASGSLLDNKDGFMGNTDILKGAAPFNELFQHNRINFPSTLFKSKYATYWSLIKDMDISCMGDWMLWLLCASKGDSAYLSTPLIKYRIHNGSDSYQNGSKAGLFMRDYLNIWDWWIKSGYKPSTSDFKQMRLVYLALSDSHFNTWKETL